MNLAQSLAAAAGAFVLALTSSGVSPTQAVAQITAEARAYLQIEPMLARTEREPCAQERRTVRAPLDAEMMKWADRIA